MQRTKYFSFRVNAEELKMINTLAKKLQRSRSDAVRMIVREAALALTQSSIIESQEEIHQELQSAVL